ncbi:MAG TPA: hypothetical protein VJ385_13840 [Fibrobacteria bacterium]|nr:hypothetical protein [Fibrobacteria bacterium]
MSSPFRESPSALRALPCALALAAACLLLPGAAWGGISDRIAAELGAPLEGAGPETPAAAEQPPASLEAAALRGAPASPSAPPAKSLHAKSLHASSGAYGEHAPLALFSVGSLAVGGIFYGINASMHRSNVGYTAGDRSQLASAAGLAGLTALLAAGSYYYYAHKRPDDSADRDAEAGAVGADGSPDKSAASRPWGARLTGGVSPDGAMSMGALLTLPLPSLSR